MALPNSEDDYLKLAFDVDQAELTAKSLPLLLAGTIGEFTVQSAEHGPIKYGRLEMRTFTGAPIYYFHMLWSNRGTFVRPGFLKEHLRGLNDQLGDQACNVVPMRRGH